MTSFRIERIGFHADQISAAATHHPRLRNWPVVYTINDDREVYVGESLNLSARMRQHLESPNKQGLTDVRAIVDDRFNKSACLDLESFLIRLFAGEGKYEVLNRNEGIVDADYYWRDEYRKTFDEVFEELRNEGLFERSIPEIQNSDLFKLSPFKALTSDQAIAVEGVLEGLFEDLERSRESTTVIQGDPGTGKTIIAIYIMKLLVDIKASADGEFSDDRDSDSMFAEFFVEGFGELLESFRIGLVVPQQSLRDSVRKVFRKTPGLERTMIVTPFEVGEDEESFDLLIVDESHRLNHRANQSSGPNNKKFADINHRLFGRDDLSFTQMDWIRARSKHQIFLVDEHQAVRPADLPRAVLDGLINTARATDRWYPLTTQMRLRADENYVEYIRGVLKGESIAPVAFENYDLKLFTSFAQMRRQIREREREHGLSRIVAGYAWKWASKKDRAAYDIEIEGERMRWNTVATDWINFKGSMEEVGSIHTVQGYDLNYAGVIIGPDLRYDETRGRIFFDRSNYFDTKGKENNPSRGIYYSDEDLLTFVSNIYCVLMTRGMLGTYVYVVDEPLRRYLSRYIPVAG